jgi:hypothetical protein
MIIRYPYTGKAILVGLFSALSLGLLLPGLAPSLQHASAQQQQQQATRSRSLDRGMFYLINNDTSDKAAREFKQVIKNYPGSQEAEDAQYALGLYYHRKYYISKEKWRRTFSESLTSASAAYREYATRYSTHGSGNWLSDARFNLSLVYMEGGAFEAAVNELSRIILYDSGRDPVINVYKLIWSPDADDVIDKDFDARELAEHTRTLAQLYKYSPDIERVVLPLKRWCKSR